MRATDLAAANRRALEASWGVTPCRARRTSLIIDATGAYPVLRMARADGAWISLNSARAPHREARSLLEGLDSGSASALVIVGAGLGYVLDEIETAGPFPPVVVLEPCAGFADAWLGRKDWTPAIAAQRLVVSCGPEFEVLAAAGRTHPDLFLAPAILVPPVVARELPAFVEAVQARLDRIRAGAHANADARRRFAAPYLLNTLANLPVLEREADVAALGGAAAGLPAIVAGAGPSLDALMDDLRDAAEQAVIIATDTAARPLLGAGVVPDVIVSVDPSDANGRHLIDLPEAPTMLVGEGSLSPEAFDGFEGRTFLFRVGRHHPWPWLESAGLGVGVLRAWGSVITSAVDLALTLGCSRVALVGADCAAVDGRPYARGTTFESNWSSRVIAGQALPEVWRAVTATWRGVRARGIGGEDLDTGPHLLAFRDWLLEEGRRRTGHLFNASGQGLLTGDGVTPIALPEFVRSFGAPAAGLEAALRGRHEASRRSRAAGRTPAPPLADGAWHAVLAEGGIEPALARQVLVAGRSAWPRRHDAALPPVAPLAEAAAVLQAAVRGQALPEWARRGLARVPAAMRPEERGDAMLSRALGLRAGPDVSCLPSQAAGLPAGDRIWLARLETHAAAALARTLARPPAGEPPLCVGAGARTDGRVEAPAALVASLEVIAAGLAAAPDDHRIERLALAALRGAVAVTDPRHPANPIDAIAVDLTIDAGRRRLRARLPVSATALARAAAGTIVTGRLDPAGGPWTVRLSVDGPAVADVAVHLDGQTVRSAGCIAPRTPAVAEACLFATTSGPLVRVDALMGRVTRTVDAAGRVSDLMTWPEPILGATSFGSAGAVAWSPAGTPRLWWRMDPGATPQAVTLPFPPAVAHAVDRDVYLAGVDGGIWIWSPEGGPRLLAACEPIRGIRTEEGSLRIDPVHLSVSGTTTRLRLRHGWRLRGASGTLERVDLDGRGPSWSTAVNAAGWIARAYACASSVEVESPRGAIFTLICPLPFAVAWAEGSLLVTCTTAGETWFYEGLVQVLESLAGPAS